jgi:HK97 gp10 family phage protein
MITFRIEGGRELEQALRKLARSVRGDVLAEGVMRAAAPLEAEMEQRVRKLTGATERAIGREVTHKSSRRVDVGIGLEKAPRGFVGTFLEYGTSHMTARPWARGSFSAQVGDMWSAMRRELWAAISRACPGGGR